jgi:hypothetical protein
VDAEFCADAAAEEKTAAQALGGAERDRVTIYKDEVTQGYSQ